MEKIGLIKKEMNKRDARVSLVKLTSAGKINLKEGVERFELFCEEIISSDKIKKIEEFSKLLVKINKNI